MRLEVRDTGPLFRVLENAHAYEGHLVVTSVRHHGQASAVGQQAEESGHVVCLCFPGRSPGHQLDQDTPQRPYVCFVGVTGPHGHFRRHPLRRAFEALAHSRLIVV